MICPASIDDDRLALYRNLKDRDLAREGGRFLAEGEWVVRRLLASPVAAESVLVADRKAASLAAAVPPGVPLFVLPERQLDELVGFKFHTGAMAVGIRPPPPPLSALVVAGGSGLIAVCPDLTGADNLGAIVRTSVGFGVDGLLLGERCCDPYFRMAVRVSMGTVFKVPVVRSRDLEKDLTTLRHDHRFELWAAVLDPAAGGLPMARAARCGLVFGNEATGLAAGQVAACDQAVTLTMRHGTDSLNVAVAAGILLHHFASISVRPADARPARPPGPA